MYRACIADHGNGVTKRSLNRIEEFLADEGKHSAFAAVARRITERFLKLDNKRIKEHIELEVERLLQQFYTSVDNLLDNEIVDEEEAGVRNQLQEQLPGLLADWENASKDLQAVKAKYGSK